MLGGRRVEVRHSEAKGADGFGNARRVTVRLGKDNRSFECPEKLIGEFVSGGSFLAVGVGNQRLEHFREVIGDGLK